MLGLFITSVVIGHVPIEISHFIFFALEHGCSVIASVVDVHHHMSPIIQGGLEIKIKVTTSWEVGNKDKFMLLKIFIERWYETSLKKGDSEAIMNL